jgi:DNA polymerase III subunit epsilon
MRQIFLDTETTGLSASGGDRILELACVEFVSRKPTGRNLHLYINPERDSHEDALRVHGITSEFLADKPKFADVATQILAFVQDAEILIHNAPFDLAFLDAELDRLGQPPFSKHVPRVTDTLVMAKDMFPGKRNSLDALCDRFEVDRSSRTFHGALLDAELLAHVYIHMTRGQDALLAEPGAGAGASQRVERSDFSALELIVLPANEQEAAAHEAVLTQLDKSSGGQTVWRKAVA